jgi:hypothetical protein
VTVNAICVCVLDEGTEPREIAKTLPGVVS